MRDSIYPNGTPCRVCGEAMTSGPAGGPVVDDTHPACQIIRDWMSGTTGTTEG